MDIETVDLETDLETNSSQARHRPSQSYAHLSLSHSPISHTQKGKPDLQHSKEVHGQKLTYHRVDLSSVSLKHAPKSELFDR